MKHILFLICLFSQPAFCQSIQQFHAENFLQSNSVQKLWVTGKNQFWVSHGLPHEIGFYNQNQTRYFDKSISGFNPSPNPVTGVWKQKSGQIWLTNRFLPPYSVGPFGTANGGLAQYSANTNWSVYNKLTQPTFNSLPEVFWESSVLHSSDSLLFVATEKGMRKINLTDFSNSLLANDSISLLHTYTTKSKQTGNQVIFQRTNGQWFGYGIGNQWQIYSPETFGLSTGWIHDLELGQDGDTLIAYQQYPFAETEVFMHKNNESIRLRDSLPDLGTDIEWMASIKVGEYWFLGRSSGLYQLKNGALKRFTQGIPSKNISLLAIDSAGKKYIGTTDQGLFVFSDIEGKIRTNHISPSPLCFGKAVQFSDSSASINGQIVERKWWFGDGDSSLLANPSHSYQKEGTYLVQLWVKDENGSEFTVFDTLIFYPSPNLQVLPLSKRIETCLGDSIFASGSGPIQWQKPDQTTSPQKSIFANQQGIYKVEVQDGSCIVRDSVEVVILPEITIELAISTMDGQLILGDFETLSVQESLRFYPTNNSQYCELVWFLNDENLGSGPESNGKPIIGKNRLQVEGRTDLGCRIFGEKSFEIHQGIIPNLVTQNNDGKNDFFKIPGNVGTNQLTIYNRWGKEVFNASPYQNDWPPADLEPGIYFYKLTAANQVFSGWVDVVK